MDNEPTTRTILINQPKTRKTPSNYIQTAKYTFYNFLPLAIINQFRNYFNFFFLCMIIIFSIKIISPVDPKSAYIPFLVIFCISIAREGYEDFKKQQYDHAYNNSLSLEYNYEQKKFQPIKWRDISIGHLIKVNKDEVIPADLLLIKSSNANGFSYMQTANLDGETALKPREAITYCQNAIQNEDNISTEIQGLLEEDVPNKNIYIIDGCLMLTNKEEIYFNISNCLLRNATLRNVDYIYGIVIYTGKETKIMQNINKGSHKSSIIDMLLNKIVIFLIIIVFVAAIILTGVGMNFHVKNQPTKDSPAMHYVFYIDKGNEATSLVLDVIRTFASFFNILSTLIPISVMVCLELCKTLQTVALSSDDNYRLGENEKTKYLSMKLHENLGAIKYIFTDKTGTLTKNEMEFKGCSIFSKLFSQDNENHSLSNLDTFCSSYKQKTIFSRDFNPQLFREAFSTNLKIFLIEEDQYNQYNRTLTEMTFEFWVNIALNHNVLVYPEEDPAKISYSGSNPDEVVLVQAAKEIKIEFIDRIGPHCKISVFDKIQEYEILQRFEFTSARKRSSIIVKDSTGTIKLYMKGADNIILKKINAFSKKYVEPDTLEHIDLFSKEGLRTLCYSMKILSQAEYDEWLIKYQKIQTDALKDKTLADNLEQIIGELEDQMILLGVSALEDLLQDDVKNSIKDFIDAEINVWMLTGDKLDTAQSIGYGCRLFNDDSEVFKISEKHASEAKLRLIDIKKEMSTVYDHNNTVNPHIPVENMTKLSRRYQSQNVYSKKRISNEVNFMSSRNHQIRKSIDFKNIQHQEESKMVTDDFLIKTTNQHSPEEVPDEQTILKYVIQKNILNNESHPEVTLSFVKRLQKKEDTIKVSTDEKNKKVDLKRIEEEIQQKLEDIDPKQVKEEDKEVHNDPNTQRSQRQTNEPDKLDLSMRNFALIIEGEAITECLKEENKKLFYEIVAECRSVICSRCSPGQKAEVVKFIKEHSKHLTLAIGDGGNDVNMIQTAHIGVGIFGKEGSQAAYSSDFAFSQFKYLRRLLFIHGRYSIHRNSYFVYFYFFKNIIFTFIQFWYTFFNGISGTLFYDDLYSLGYNSFITTILPCLYSIFEEDIDVYFEDNSKKEMAKLLMPELYKEMRDSIPFSIKKFLFAISLGFMFSLLFFFTPFLAFDSNICNLTGKVHSFADQSLSTYMSLVIFVYIVQFTDTYYFNLWVIVIDCLQILISVVFVFVQNTMPNHLVSERLFDIIGNSRFWAITMFTLGFNYSIVYILRSYERYFSDNLSCRMRNNLILNDIKRNIYRKKIIETKKYSRFIEKFKKLYLKKDAFEADTYMDKKLKECVADFKSKRAQNKTPQPGMISLFKPVTIDINKP